MSNPQVDHFGRILMQRVRDKAIIEWDAIFSGHMKGKSAEEIRQRLRCLGDSELELLRWLIPRIVDTSIHHLLWTLEQERSVTVAVKVGNEHIDDVAEASDGLCGEMYGDEGWLMRFSGQRKGLV